MPIGPYGSTEDVSIGLEPEHESPQELFVPLAIPRRDRGHRLPVFLGQIGQVVESPDDASRNATGERLCEPFGLIAWSLDHEERLTDLDHYEATLKHELVHVVEDLLDPDGYSKTPAELTRIFVDVAEGSTFPEAFERHVGVGLEEYETQFFDLMNEYLS